MEHHRRNFLDTLGLFPARCVMAALLGLLLAAGNAEAENALWMANENSPTLAEFQGTLKSGSKKPYGLINDAYDLDAASTIAFDQNGNLWVTNFHANSISEFTNSQWGEARKHQRPTAAATISEDPGNFLNGPEGIVFDSAQNMWVGAEDGQAILMYKPAQYAGSGNPTPAVILNAASFKLRLAIAPEFRCGRQSMGGR